VGETTTLSFQASAYGSDANDQDIILKHPAESHYQVEIAGQNFDVDGTYGGLDAAQPEWKQRYLTAVPEADKATDATSEQNYLILPFQWNESTEVGFAGYKAYHTADWWKLSRTFASQCAGCHNTGAHYAFDAVDPKVVTHFEYTELNVSCESCHGPGSAHVDAGGGKAVAIIQPNFMMDLEGQEVCGQCHNRAKSVDPSGALGYPWNESLGGAYKIGEPLIDWYTWTFLPENGFAGNLVENPGWYWVAPEGSELYPDQYISSKDHHEQITDLVHGVMPMVKCGQCHDPHGTAHNYMLRYYDFPLDGTCLLCHGVVPGVRVGVDY